MPQQKPWEKDWSAPQQGPIVLGTPNPTRAPLDRAELQNRELQAQKSQLEIQQLRQKLLQENGGAPIDPKMDALTGQAYLNALPKARASQVRALIEGRMAFPSGSGMRSPYWQALLTDVAHADPEFDAVNYNSRAATRRDFTAGKSAQNIKALNTAIGHVGQLYDQIPGTASHGGYPLATTVNSLQNAYERSSGDPGITKYEQTAGAVASELTQVFRGTGGAEADVKRYLGELNSNASAEQKKAAVQNIVGLLNSRLQAIGDQYTKGMGTTAQPLQVLDQHAQEVLGKLGGLDGQQPPGMAAPGAIPPTGGPTMPPGAPPGGGGPIPPSAPPGGQTADKSTKWFGNGTDPNGIEQFNIPTSMKGESLQKDPVMAAAAKHLAAMIADRRIPDAAIMDYATNLNADPASVMANLKFRHDHPSYTGGYNTDSLGFKNVPVTAAQWIGNNIGTSPIGAAAIQGANAVSGNSLANLTANPDATRALIAGTAQMNPKSAFVGNVGGGALAAAGLEAGGGALALKAGLGAKALPWVPRAADAVYGGISGANSNPNDPLSGALLGGVAGVGGGMFGRGVAKAGGSALSGVRDEGVQMLKDRGVPMTLGQAVGQSGWLGGAVKGAEDRLSGLPLVGDMINARRREGVQGFNTAAFKEGLAPIASTLPPVGQQAVNGIGEQGIGNMQQSVSGAYGHALNGVQVTPDAQFSQELGNALGLGAAIPRTGPEFAHVVKTDIQPHFAGPPVNGPQIQDILQTVRGTNFGNDAMGNAANDAMSNVGGAVSDLVGRQHPGVIPALGAANTGYRNLNILADAVGKGSNTGGLFTAAQLGTAAKANTTRFGGKIAAAMPTRPFFQLQRAGQEVLPSKVPDSGTAGRMALATLLPGATSALGGGVGYAAGDARGGAEAGGEAGIVSLMALAAGGSKPAQKLLTALVLNRSNGMIAAGKAVAGRAPIAGMFGAGASPLLLPQQ